MANTTRPDTTGSTFEQLLEAVPDAIVGVDPDGRIVLVNSDTEALFGYTREAAAREVGRGARPGALPQCPRRSSRELLRRASHPADGTRSELAAVRRDGTEFPAEISLSSIETEDGTVVMAAVRDISERAESEQERALQEQLARARRLESVGQLAGGIAHDFNNILGVIINYAEFVADELEPGSQTLQDVEEIRRAAERAAALTRQLLDLQPARGRQAGGALPAQRRRRAGESPAQGAGRADRAGHPLRRGPLRGGSRPRPGRAGARQPGGQRPRCDAGRGAPGDRGRTDRARR